MPKPLEGIRILDFTWLNAGAKGSRHLAAYGAEVIRIEWTGKLDFIRFGFPQQPAPGEAGDSGTASLGAFDRSKVKSINRSARWNNTNAGKMGISLNMRDERGKDLFRRLLPLADVVTDNYTATTLERWGFSYEEMRRHKPDIVYVQAPGFGRTGPYRDFRSYGPIAAGISGLQFMSGLPDRASCGYSFSYLDVGGPWFIGMAVMAALHHRARTGQGQHVDLSQAGPGFLLTGTAVFDYTANGRHYERSGNRAPYTRAAPHSAYPCRGEDRWVAIAVSNDQEWRSFCGAIGNPAWTKNERFATPEARYEHQSEMDSHIESWTKERDRYEVMHLLQRAGVPAGVCQNTQDRLEVDEQLIHRGYMEEVHHSEVVSHRVEGIVGKWSKTQPHASGATGWGAPCYGEHNQRVYGDILGLSEAEVEGLAADAII
ncbi:MAG: CoA transferase [Chloroflexi bacterium]|nr:CoA transferase [Chloroflexota bacterium]